LQHVHQYLDSPALDIPEERTQSMALDEDLYAKLLYYSGHWTERAEISVYLIFNAFYTQ